MNTPTLPGEFEETARSGPETGDQLDALEALRETAVLQAAVTAVLPVYTGPVTGDQLGELGTLERAAIGRAAEEIGAVPARPERRSRSRRQPWPGAPLTAVLVVQAALSLRLIWSNTAFTDEGLYIRAGHLEIAHWLHGTAIPAFPTYFSGAPVIYPPLGAMADALGGLAGARLLSLVFMLGATALLYATARRLPGRRTAIMAAALFAAVGTGADLGAFATYDAMAIFLLALATWLTVRAGGPASEALLVIASLIMALADGAKYASALWNPVIIGVAVLAAGQGGWLRRAFRGVRMAGYTAVVLAVALLRFGGHLYVQGIMFTTLARADSSASARTALWTAATYIGVLFCLAIAGAWAGSTAGRRTRLLLVLLAVAVILAPVEEARIHTIDSLYKHVVFGAWFGSVAAGYAVARAVEVNARKGWRIGVATAAFCGAIGYGQATSMFGYWPDSARMVGALTTQAAARPGPILTQASSIFSPNVLDYYLYEQGGEAATAGVTGYSGDDAPALAGIRDGFYRLVETDVPAVPDRSDSLIVAALRSTPGYKLIASLHWRDAYTSGTFEVWRYRPAGGAR